MITIPIRLRCDHGVRSCTAFADHEARIEACVGWSGQVEIKIVPVEPLPPGWKVGATDLAFCEIHVPGWLT